MSAAASAPTTSSLAGGAACARISERHGFPFFCAPVGAAAQHEPDKGWVDLGHQQAGQAMPGPRAAVAVQQVRDLVQGDVRLVPGRGAFLVEDVVGLGGADPQAAVGSG